VETSPHSSQIKKIEKRFKFQSAKKEKKSRQEADYVTKSQKKQKNKSGKRYEMLS
jgi:hypothetical protein